MKFKKGFTLIELLVVIAIIGILASVVLASLNSARTKGKDAAAISSMSQARAAAEIAYSNLSSSYANICPAVDGTTSVWSAVNATNSTTTVEFSNAIKNGQSAIGTPTLPTTPGGVVCGSNATSYAVTLKLNNSGYYCVDGTGFAGNRTTAGIISNGTAPDVYKCPAS